MWEDWGAINAGHAHSPFTATKTDHLGTSQQKGERFLGAHMKEVRTWVGIDSSGKQTKGQNHLICDIDKGGGSRR